MTKVSYAVSINGRKGSVKADTYIRAIEIQKGLQAQGYSATITTVYTKIENVVNERTKAHARKIAEIYGIAY